ncbi:Putative Holin-X, holin superfamily III [Modestobacter sp. DSM 44400]|uniref:phage holin family protein n=1 Tax=Modestobacter sp. DSM 44400 TaxID=1550230 RepID=UPI00089B8A0E|nr:phage holin family protein [Modestobacter sp. DSM 44400]SDX78425.1 Putative Holin-X, holin superfamily III [Modestobacter sp. DSM 44400]
MSRRGWVSARDAAGDWWVLSVYDDGWCAVPAPVRTAEDTRRRVRQLIATLVTVVGLFAAAAATAALVPSAPWLSYLLLAASLGVLVLLGVRAARRRVRDRPPVFATSGEQAAAVDGARRTARDQVRRVALHREGHEDVVTVTVRRGAPLVYRSPDRTLGRLLSAWAPTAG